MCRPSGLAEPIVARLLFMSTLQTPFGHFALKRWPASTDKSLQAWDASDELLLAHVHEHLNASQQSRCRLLICNDAHGALGCALHEYDPVMWSDSYLAHGALEQNLERNGLSGQPDPLDSLTTPEGSFDLILIKIPKTYALLEDQLARIRPLLHERSVVVATSMTRHLHRTALALFEKYIGDVTTSLAVKKARLVFCVPDLELPAIASPFPDRYTDDDLNITLSNHANVFCRDKVDIGARFFLEHCRQLPEAGDILDLACGNGILGIYAQRLQPQARLHFIDESYMAVASTKENYASVINQSSQAAVFRIGNGLEGIDSDSIDLILCNPPFHVQHAIADDTARSFFKHASRCLKHGGQMWVVANRHLRYRSYLGRYFNHCDIVASNSKFVLLKAMA